MTHRILTLTIAPLAKMRSVCAESPRIELRSGRALGYHPSTLLTPRTTLTHGWTGACTTSWESCTTVDLSPCSPTARRSLYVRGNVLRKRFAWLG
eukprot:2074092-Pyramimonas_sp.AAC.1